MADYSGTVNADITLQDGDTIGSSNNLQTGSGYNITAEAGATIEVYAGRYVICNAGDFTIVGTESNPITFEAQEADPSYDSWNSLRTNGGTLTMEYVILKNAQYGIYRAYAGTYSYNKIRLEKCRYSMYCVATGDYTFEMSNVYVYEGDFGNFDRNKSGTASVSLDTVWGKQTTSQMIVDDGMEVSVNDVVLESQISGFAPLYRVNDTAELTVTDSWIKNTAYATYCYEGTITITGIVVDDSSRGIYANLAASTITSSYNDLLNCNYYSHQAQNSAVIDSDYDAVAGCNHRPSDLFDVSTGTQYDGLNSHTNAMSTLNKPLSVDNVSEGAPTSDAITITFDCAAGTTSKRNKGLGFIKYGTVSGTYDMQSKLPDKEDWGLYWIQWYTDYEYKSTGHSVTLSNLKAGTTYYYKCCFVDPLGRVGESSEASFTTSGGTDYPAETDVRDGIDYDSGNFTGNLTLPASGNVYDGITYGANGTEFTGSLSADTPTFSGITCLERIAPGQLKASWSAGSDLTGYKIYVRKGSEPTFADDTYLWGIVDDTKTSVIINTEEDNDTLLYGDGAMYVCVRGYNCLGDSEDSNTTIMHLTPDGGLMLNNQKIQVLRVD